MTNLEAFGGLLSEHSSIDSSRAALFFANLTFRALFVEHFLAARWVSSLDSGFRMPKILGKNFLVSLDIIIPSAGLQIPAYPTHFTILMTAFRRSLCLGEQVCCDIWIGLLHLRCHCWGRRALARFLFLTALFQQLFLTAESIYYIYVSRNQIRCVLIISTLRSDRRESPERFPSRANPERDLSLTQLSAAPYE